MFFILAFLFEGCPIIKHPISILIITYLIAACILRMNFAS